MKSPVKTIFRALLAVSLFLPVYYTFAAGPPDVRESNNNSQDVPNIHENKSHARENIPCNDTEPIIPYSTDIKDLFRWSGWSFNAVLDVNKDGIIDKKDIPAAYDLIENKGNGDGIIDDNEFNNWLSDAEYVGLAAYYDDEPILDIADPVVIDQAVTSHGTEI